MLQIRPIDPTNESEIQLVASRMKLTLMEVLGEVVGAEMYSDEWLVERVKFHLNPELCVGEVLLARVHSEIIGHTILRVEEESFGLFSTFYVAPEWRRQGIAKALVLAGEDWFRERRLSEARTYTGEENSNLITLMEEFGYEIFLRKNKMVALSRVLAES
jgi:GNAT superfamily N-acetyltransferase